MLAKEMGFGVKSLFNATFSAAAATSPPPPVGTIGAAPSTTLESGNDGCSDVTVGSGNGTCGPTNFGGDCNSDPKGAWDANKENIKTLEQCVAKAKPCAMADFVSFSNVPGNADCAPNR